MVSLHAHRLFSGRLAHAKKTPVDKLGVVRHFVSLGAELLWEAGELSKLFRADDRCPSAMESTEILTEHYYSMHVFFVESPLAFLFHLSH